jgi:EAL domain-containing protein (putative c-di-GMP-specific phosphodiesterase class I)
VSTIINLAHSPKLYDVAEGVESEQQSRLLRLLNGDQMRDSLFSKPVPKEIFATGFLGPDLRRVTNHDVAAANLALVLL